MPDVVVMAVNSLEDFRARLGCNAVELSDVQTLMEELFGDVDRKRGLPSSVAWLCEEVGEFAQAIRKGTPEQQLHELGDVIAWTVSLANQLGLSLEAALARYEATAAAQRKPATAHVGHAEL